MVWCLFRLLPCTFLSAVDLNQIASLGRSLRLQPVATSNTEPLGGPSSGAGGGPGGGDSKGGGVGMGTFSVVVILTDFAQVPTKAEREVGAEAMFKSDTDADTASEAYQVEHPSDLPCLQHNLGISLPEVNATGGSGLVTMRPEAREAFVVLSEASPPGRFTTSSCFVSHRFPFRFTRT